MNFHKIRFHKLPDDITQFEKVIGLLYNMHYDKYKDMIDLSDVWIRPCHKFQDPIYVSRLANPQNLKNVKEYDTLVVNEQMTNESEQISGSFRCN